MGCEDGRVMGRDWLSAQRRSGDGAPSYRSNLRGPSGLMEEPAPSGDLDRYQFLAHEPDGLGKASRVLEPGAATVSENVVVIRRALFSVSDKQGLIDLAQFLAGQGVELVASGGTRSALVASGLEVIEVADYTGQPEVLGGRVKTLHPKIHAGILARRDVPGDLATLEQQGFPPIDLVVVNLYPFQRPRSRGPMRRWRTRSRTLTSADRA